MTITRPWRRMTLHFSHMGLTLGRTFIERRLLLVPIGDPTSGEVVRGDLHLHPIAGEDADPVHAHAAGAVGQDFVAVLELDLEHGIGKGLDDRPFEHDRIFLGLGQVSPPEDGLRVLQLRYGTWPTGAGAASKARRAKRRS